MANVLYNHLRVLGYLVDVGIVESSEMKNGKTSYSQREIDFIANKGSQRYYIQSAYSISSEEKRKQGLTSLLKISGSFKKIVVVGDEIMPYSDDNGYISPDCLIFLLKDDCQ